MFRKRVIHSTLWGFSLRIGMRFGGFLQLVLLARLLTPEDFGLYGIALLTLSFLQSASKLAFDAALIQRQGNIQDHFNTLWTVQALRGLLLAILVVLSAGPVAHFFNEPQLVPYIMATALTPLLEGLNNPATVLFQKELNFRLEFWFRISGTISSILVAVGAALLLRNAWALVLAYITSNLIQTIASFVIHPYRPRPEFNSTRFREMFEFGKWMMGAAVIKSISNSIPDLIVGKIISVSSLGLYRVAQRIATYAGNDLFYAIRVVSFPVFSELLGNRDRLRRAYLMSQRGGSFIICPLYGLIFVFTESIVAIVLGPQWMATVPVVRIMALLGMIESIGIFGQILKAGGRPNVIMAVALMRLLIISISIYPMTVSWGMQGAAGAVLLSLCISYPLNMKYGLETAGCNYREFFSAVLPNLAVTLVMVGLASGVQVYVGKDLLGLGFLLTLCATTYFTSSFLIDRITGRPLMTCYRAIKAGL